MKIIGTWVRSKKKKSILISKELYDVTTGTLGTLVKQDIICDLIFTTLFYVQALVITMLLYQKICQNPFMRLFFSIAS